MFYSSVKWIKAVKPLRLTRSLLLTGMVFICATSNAQQYGYFVSNPTELKDALKELKEKYSPYLQSFNEPVKIRNKQLIGDDWVSKFEIENATDTILPVAPLWYLPKLEIAQWFRVSVPEWRYGSPDPEKEMHQRNHGNRIVWYRTVTDRVKHAKGERVFLVFEGVDWMAEVYFNGKFLGRHTEYFEPFRFEVTDLLQEINTIAVRVIDGSKFGEQAAFWSLFPVVPAKEQKYVRDKSKSIVGFTKGDLHLGNGYGINSDVYFEQTNEAILENVFVRALPQLDGAKISIDIDSQQEKDFDYEVELLPENFKGKKFTSSFRKNSRNKNFQFNLPAKGAEVWSPDHPYLYLCRILLKSRGKLVDVKDILFGFRTFAMVSEKYPKDQLLPGTFLLNGQQTFLRGTNLQGLNPLLFWGERQKAIDILLMIKAANFNFVRSCQHVQLREVRELQDRLGIMSLQEKGSRYPEFGKRTESFLIDAVEKLTKEVYNNPGVVMLSFANEEESFRDCSREIEAVLKIDNERIIDPVSGIKHSGEYAVAPGTYYNLSENLYANVIEDLHEYPGWYKFNEQPWKYCRLIETNRLVLKGEFGAEAIDGYETMLKAYPKEWGQIPPPTTDTLIGNVQTVKGSKRMFLGLDGKFPKNLQENITASQHYQAYILDETTKGYRASPKHVSGYCQFHFFDVSAANWPKSIVSHDLTPKEGYFAMAQANQPLVALPVLSELKDEIDILVANDLSQEVKSARIEWKISIENEIIEKGSTVATIPADNVLKVAGITIGKSIPKDTRTIKIETLIYNDQNQLLSKYSRPVFIRAWRYKDGIFNQK